MKAKPADLRARLARLDPATRLYLLFGPDESGAEALADAVVSALGEGLERIDLSGSDMKSDPARLADEAASLSLFGDARYIRARVQGDEALAAVTNLLEADQAVNPVVMVASGMTDKGRTAKLAYASPLALGCICYPPGAHELAMAVREMATARGVELASGMAQRIVASCSGDRRLAAQEVEKLALYLDASPDEPKPAQADLLDSLGAETEDDAMAPIVNMVLSGQAKRLGHEFDRMALKGISEIGLLLALQRRAVQLSGLAAKARGGDVAGLVESEVRARRIFFRDKPDIVAQLNSWRPAALVRLTERLLDVHGRMMRSSQSATLLLRQELLEICQAAARMKR